MLWQRAFNKCDRFRQKAFVAGQHTLDVNLGVFGDHLFSSAFKTLLAASVTTVPGRNEVVFRGVSTGTGEWRTDSGSAVYLGDVPMTSATQAVDPRMVDIERVEAQVEEGIAVVKRERCEAVIGFGGGSADIATRSLEPLHELIRRDEAWRAAREAAAKVETWLTVAEHEDPRHDPEGRTQRQHVAERRRHRVESGEEQQEADVQDLAAGEEPATVLGMALQDPIEPALTLTIASGLFR